VTCFSLSIRSHGTKNIRTITISLSIVANTNSHVKKTHDALQKIPFLLWIIFHCIIQRQFHIACVEICLVYLYSTCQVCAILSTIFRTLQEYISYSYKRIILWNQKVTFSFNTKYSPFCLIVMSTHSCMSI
jgi:hypothetical protein